MEKRTSSFVILVFVLALAAVCAVREGVPSPSAATAPVDQFSAERAMVYLNTFATAPHPIGSKEHDRVRDYLIAQFRSLGLEPEVQRATGVTPRYEVAGTVENIVARLKATSGSPDAVALVAHYDSVPAGPGAGDDGAGVAALLETVRALRAGPPLKNDVLFLITDGEEDGLLGASAFAAENPLAKDVRVVVNFEARGDAGPSQMFETSVGNGRLVQLFGEASPHPNGSSLTYEIYQHMPNDTDMTVFKKAGDAGLNFAFIGNWSAYHTPLDNPQNLDRGSLQQHGENALSLARSLGNARLDELRGPDDVYFSLPGNLFARYSVGWVWPLTICVGIFLVVVIVYGMKALGARPLAIVAAVFVHLGFILALTALFFLFFGVVRWLHAHPLPEGPLDQNTLYLLGLVALLGAAASGLYVWAGRKIAASSFFLGGAVLIYAVLLVVSRFLPGGSNFFSWPLLAALLAAVTVAFRPGERSAAAIFALCLLSIPVIVLFVPLMHGLYNAMGFTQIGAPLLGCTFALMFLLLFPFLEMPLAHFRKSLPLLALAVAIVLSTVASFTTRYSSAHPKPSLLSYALDADTGKALWTSSVSRVDAWTANYLGTSPRRAKLRDFAPDWYPFDFFVNDAVAVPVDPPNAQLLDSASDGAGRLLHFRITSPRHARTIHLGVAGATVQSASVNGRDLGKPSEARWHQTGSWGFDYANPGDGLDVLLHLQDTGRVTLVLVDRSSGLPVLPGASLPPRPPDSMPIHTGDQTMVRRSFVF